MYTYHHVISRLTEAEKVRLLTDLNRLSETEAAGLGAPQVICASLREGCPGETSEAFPTPALLARSWDRALVEEIGAEMTRRLAARGVNHILLPPAGTAIVPDGERLSEDPCLSGTLAGAWLAGVRKGGLTATATGYGFTEADRRGMDTPVSPRFYRDHMTAPYALLGESGRLTGIIAENDDPVPSVLAEEGYFILRRSASERETVKALSRGELLVRGSAEGLQAALHTYRRLKTAISHGKATAGELETAVAEGEAMSEETLDASLDRLFTFAAACREGAAVIHPKETAVASDSVDGSPTESAKTVGIEEESPTESEKAADMESASTTNAENSLGSGEKVPTAPSEDAPIEPPFDTASSERPAASSATPDSLALRALDGATVLLENRDRLLPLVKPARVCILGDVAREGGDVLPLIEAINRHGHTWVGFARGYDPASERDDGLTAEAVALAARADVVLLFAETARGESRLPAPQLALLDEVGRLAATRPGKKTVVVLSSEVSPDMGFVRTAVTPIAGLLLTPLSVKGAALHAVETLLGDRAPLGRLTETLTDARDPAADRRGYKAGPFPGYRYYDTVGLGAVYPFGFGLSYTKFRYASVKVRDGEITFTVQNVGKRAGVAVPQVYAAPKNSAVLRPKKELAAFTHIRLAPGEKATVTLPWSPPAADGAGTVEKGTYRLFVGESVSDIRLTAAVSVMGDTVESDGAAPHEYLPTASNILTERYVLEAEYTPMKPSLRNLIFGIAALVLAVSVKIYDIVSVSGAVFLNIVAGLLAVGAVFFFVLELLDRKKQFARERAELEEANATLFADAADIPVPSADALFEMADDLPAEDGAGKETAPADGQDYLLDADKELTFPAAVSALTTLAAEKGLALDRETARGIFAAMASARLLITRELSEERFSALVSLLCEYVGCPVAVDTVDGSYTDEAALLYGRNEAGETVRRRAADAVEAARRDPRAIHLVALNEVSLETVSDYFVPYARYARAPHGACAVKTRDAEGAETACLLPENLWFILNLREGEGLHRMPDYITEVAAVLTPCFESVPSTATHTEFAPFRYGQMLYLCDRLKASFSAEEDTWKRIDRLEAYAARFGGFAMTNKLWLGLETYLAVLLAVETDPAAALDEALAARLMPALIPALSGNIPREERGLSETLEAVLGDGNATVCRRTVKESGADLT